MPSPTPAPRRRSLVHHADFRRLWAGDALGQLGAQLTMLALPVFAVQHLHATAWQMGALTAAETAAFLVIGLPAGAWVDRMRKRNVLVTADLVRGLVLTVVVVAALTGHAKAADPVAAWLEAGGERVARIRERLQALTEGGDITVSRLSVASGLMSDLSAR